MATKQEVKNFLKNMHPKDKFDLIFHNDLDGFASGILFYDYLKKKKCNDIEIFPFEIGNPKFSNLENNLKNREKVVILDLAPNLIFPQMNNLLKGKEVLYLDHHKSNIQIKEKNVLEYRVIDKYIPCSRIVYEFLKGREWISVAGTISDVGEKYKENKKFINNFLKKENLTLEEYRSNVVSPLSYLLIFFEKNPEMAFEILKDTKKFESIKNLKKYISPIEKEVEYYEKDFEKNNENINGINFYYFNPKFSIKTMILNKISNFNSNEVYILARPENNKVMLGARCQAGKVNVIDILKNATEGLKNSSYGGHSMAAGGMIQSKDLDRFKENLRNIKI
ncbi:MAG: DHHA1 domain-containing protein [Nanoarchaeota archaeon]|nr:DHHA1 domain-containing protein [Nanoarchaeota archaeon]